MLSAPTIGADEAIYIVATTVLQASYPDGTELWLCDINANINATPAISADGSVYCSSMIKSLYAIGPGQ